jgi:hypothetical protein
MHLTVIRGSCLSIERYVCVLILSFPLGEFIERFFFIVKRYLKNF